MKNLIVILTTGLLLSGCATVSYAPPATNLNPENKDLNGAIELVDGFIDAYRHRANSASNGRQLFDVPAFGTAIGAVAATAFGAGTDVTIAAGAVGALSGAGKTYYAPTAKAEIYADGINALTCIQQVALDLEPFSDDATISLSAGARRALYINDTNINDFRIFTAIKNATLVVESNVRSRLSKTGSSPDVSSLTAELQKIIEKKNEAEEAAEDVSTTIDPASGARISLNLQDQRTLKNIIALMPKLEECAIRSKA